MFTIPQIIILSQAIDSSFVIKHQRKSTETRSMKTKSKSTQQFRIQQKALQTKLDILTETIDRNKSQLSILKSKVDRSKPLLLTVWQKVQKKQNMLEERIKDGQLRIQKIERLTNNNNKFQQITMKILQMKGVQSFRMNTNKNLNSKEQQGVPSRLILQQLLRSRQNRVSRNQAQLSFSPHQYRQNTYENHISRITQTKQENNYKQVNNNIKEMIFQIGKQLRLRTQIIKKVRKQLNPSSTTFSKFKSKSQVKIRTMKNQEKQKTGQKINQKLIQRGAKNLKFQTKR